MWGIALGLWELHWDSYNILEACCLLSVSVEAEWVQVEVCDMWEKLWREEGIAKLENDEWGMRFQLVGGFLPGNSAWESFSVSCVELWTTSNTWALPMKSALALYHTTAAQRTLLGKLLKTWTSADLLRTDKIQSKQQTWNFGSSLERFLFCLLDEQSSWDAKLKYFDERSKKWTSYQILIDFGIHKLMKNITNKVVCRQSKWATSRHTKINFWQ